MWKISSILANTLVKPLGIQGIEQDAITLSSTTAQTKTYPGATGVYIFAGTAKKLRLKIDHTLLTTTGTPPKVDITEDDQEVGKWMLIPEGVPFALTGLEPTEISVTIRAHEAGDAGTVAFIILR
jgi:hypothetical protein